MGALEINIKEFITPAHKKAIQQTIADAIDKVDVDEVALSLQQAICDQDFLEYAVEDMDTDKLSKAISKFLFKTLDDKLK